MKIGKRMFPGRKKRVVRAVMMTWINHDPDAHHYRVKIMEDENPIWTGQCWSYSSEDKGCRGKEIINGKIYNGNDCPVQHPFHDYKSAEAYCKDMFKEYFSTKTHKLVIEVVE